MLRPVSKKSLSEIIKEWDALAPVRYRQISTGEDISYNYVIVPSLLDLIAPLTPSSILDVGCGTGAFTSHLSAIAQKVIGVDPSGGSIEIARSLNDSRAQFVQDTIEKFSTNSEVRFDVIVANMMLMDALSLADVLNSCRQLLQSNGAFVFSITHPCFWPDYYGYGHAEWFHYEHEIIVESPFRITSDRSGSLVSTHVHRPLSAYFNAFRTAGFNVQILREPMPPDKVDQNYKAQWTAPRYLIGLCRAISPASSLL